MTVSEFKKKHKADQQVFSKLFKYKKEIEELLKDNYSQAQIINFLSLNDVKTTQQNLSVFIRRHLQIFKEKSEKKVVDDLTDKFKHLL